MKSTVKGGVALRRSLEAMLLAGLCGGFASTAHAFTITTPNPDIQMDLDTTLRANYGVRLQGLNPTIANNPSYDEGDNTFKRYQTMLARLDITSEFDFKYKDTTGFRFSIAGWYDAAYSGKDKSAPGLQNVANYPGNNYTGYIKKYYIGPSAEVRDAFVFTTVNAGHVPIDIKVGRLAQIWGQSLIGSVGGVNSVAVSQAPQNLIAATQSPGASLKELSLPTGQVAASAQVTNKLQLSGYYSFEWLPDRYPEGGTYFGGSDSINYGPPISAYAGTFPIFNRKGPQGDIGDIGVEAKYRLEKFSSTVELTYRRFTYKTPWFDQFNLANFTTEDIYANKVQLLGIGVNSQIAGTAVGAEVSYRRNTPLSSAGSASPGSLEGARGDTLHALLNTTTYLGKSFLWNEAPLAMEIAAAHLIKVTSGAQNFNAPGYSAACTSASDAVALGCATRNFYTFGVSFTPHWNQVFPGVDLDLPLFVQWNIHGNTPTVDGGNQGSNIYQVGLQFTIYNKHIVNLTYTGYTNWKRTATNVNGAPYSDKGWFGITYQTTL
ncbi:hypothetical protein C9I57_20375 [Trinickia symbiotica]|uniref:DUF1302 domain-containing protein n=1 Tax=Trinickia symbiotica TaxID=863227 RepID=A0A2T3XQQ0_9BURK|nr:DUF1302 family protein [Trinickia symbiotica]PTB18856.1 hypothetical protein C9I57_20375 [Trinickia symbiotica]